MSAPKKLIKALEKGADSSLVVSRWVRRIAREEAEAGGTFSDCLDRYKPGVWPTFTREMFASLYAVDVGVPDAPEEGSEWIAGIIDEAKALPGWKKLARHSAGDAWVSGMSADRIVGELKPVLDEILKDAPAEDPVQANQQAQQLQQQAAQDRAQADANPGDIQGEATAQQSEQAAAAAQAVADKALEWAAAANESLQEKQNQVMHAIAKAIAGSAKDAADDAALVATLFPGAGTCLGTQVRPTEEVIKRLRNDQHIKRIATIAGRMKISMRRVQAAKSVYGCEERYAVEQGDDVQRLLAQEHTLLADPDTELLLDARLIEKQAALYAQRGKAFEERGPIVVLLDESGSMSGERQQWACGVALALIELAQKQRRGWCVAHYQGSVTRHLICKPGENADPGKLLDAVSAHTGGGTDIACALAWAQRNMPLGKQADVVVVSDGGDYGFAPAIEELRAQNVRVYGIEVDSAFPSPERELFAAVSTVSMREGVRGEASVDAVLAI